MQRLVVRHLTQLYAVSGAEPIQGATTAIAALQPQMETGSAAKEEMG